MKRVLVLLVLALVCGVVRADGFIVTYENDIFLHTDNNYSSGSELEWVSEPKMDKDGSFRIGWGMDEIMYTPTDITSKLMPPQSEHPWCGTMSIFREAWTRGDNGDEVRMRYQLGVLGPLAGADFFQTSVHRSIHNDLPQGWGNQLPNEPMMNYYYDRYHLLWNDNIDKWDADLKAIGGGTAGTTFDNVRVGFQVRAGYNIPRNSMPGGIDPKVSKPGEEDDGGFFAYFTGVFQEYNVAHNSTVGESFFVQRQPGQDRTLVPVVGEYKYGFVVGYGELSFTYMLCHRSNEFQHEMDGGMDWGMVRLEWLHQF